MKAVKSIDEIRDILKRVKNENKTVGFVPTMGYLHEGHMSLMENARKENDFVVCSIFVNPIQFGKGEDLKSYPRNIEKDISICSDMGIDLIFAPEAREMYTSNFKSFVDINDLSEGLCGSSRPTHFKGVCTVVSKLFNIVMPDRAYFGEKDAQQLVIIKKLTKDLNFPIEIKGCKIVREKDGLAKSSRNAYLDLDERKAATILNKSLNFAKELLSRGERDASKIKLEIRNILNSEEKAKIDYIEVVELENLKEIDIIQSETLIAIAVYIGKTRLIDNFIWRI